MDPSNTLRRIAVGRGSAHILPETGHVPHREQEKLLIDVIGQFLRGLPTNSVAHSSLAPGKATTASDEFAGREQLRASSAEFRRDVIQVTDGVFVAVGHSASNVTLIQGRDGSIIVDTSANPVDARAIAEAFGDRLARPVRDHL